MDIAIDFVIVKHYKNVNHDFACPCQLNKVLPKDACLACGGISVSRVRGLMATVYLRRKQVVGLMDTDGAVEALGHRKIKEYGGIKQRNLLYQWFHFNSFLIYLLNKSY